MSVQNYAGGLDPPVTAQLQTSAWGWHQETEVHFLHLVLAGMFDRYPTLQVILDHAERHVQPGPAALCIDTVEVDRILYAVDYPFIDNDAAATFLEQADLPEEAKAAIASSAIPNGY